MSNHTAGLSGTISIGGVVRNLGMWSFYAGPAALLYFQPYAACPKPATNVSVVIDAHCNDGGYIASWHWSGTVDISEAGVSSGAEAAPDPVSVAISGSDNVFMGTSYTYDAEVSPGTGPYTVQFERSSTEHPADDLVYSVQSGAGTSWHQAMSFPSVDDTYVISVTVTDSASPATSDTDTMTVNASAGKPVLYGALVRGANNLPTFALYSSSPGSPPDLAAGLATSSYVVTSPEWALKGARSYVLNVASPYANPLKVYVTYTDPLNLLEWSYVFSFDTTSMDSEGDYDTSDDVPGDGADVVPTWLRGLVNSIKDMLDKLFRFLFVPTASQIDQLLPTGTLGATLLEGTSWDSGDSTWTMHVHWGESEVVLVDVDFADLGAFGTAVKVIVQAGVCLALIYMVVVLL
jgi:hypothetical protein